MVTQNEASGISISSEDLKALAQVNPLAWEQLLHIADMRMAQERIAELEAENSKLHGAVVSDELVSSNGFISDKIVESSLS